MARKSARTAARLDAIIAALRAGSTLKDAAARSGCTYETLRAWQRDSASFSALCDEAMATWKVSQVAFITRAGARDWRAAAWNLEHHPATRGDFGPGATRVTVEGGAEPVKVAVAGVVELSAGERLAELAATLDLLTRIGVVPSLGTGDD